MIICYNIQNVLSGYLAVNPSFWGFEFEISIQGRALDIVISISKLS
jgi:hypothetical protein